MRRDIHNFIGKAVEHQDRTQNESSAFVVAAAGLCRWIVCTSRTGTAPRGERLIEYMRGKVV